VLDMLTTHVQVGAHVSQKLSKLEQHTSKLQQMTKCVIFVTSAMF